MDLQITLTDITAIAGLIFGLTGLVVSVGNHFRDRANLVVNLQWDMTFSGTGEKAGILTITNKGRRPAYISHAALKMPKGAPNEFIIIRDSIAGEKLDEGDPPKIYVIHYDAVLLDQRDYWKEIRAQVSDSTGKEWLSKRKRKKKIPSWAKIDDA